MVAYINVIYIVIDIILIVLAMIVALKWGKYGLMALTLWFIAMGIVAYSIGDLLWLIGAKSSGGLGILGTLNPDTPWEMEFADFSYLAAIILWLIGFSIPVRFLFSSCPVKPNEKGKEDEKNKKMK